MPESTGLTDAESMVCAITRKGGRKCETWECIPEINFTPDLYESMRTLYHLTDKDLNISNPLDDIAPAFKYFRFFVLRRDGKIYLVNTEGYEYCRYLVRVI